MFPLYINYPSFIHPQIFPGIPVLGLLRWYGLMYIFAFATAFMILRKEMNEGMLNNENYKATEDDIISFIATGIIFLLIGARIFATMVYDTSGLYRQKPWLIFWPFDTTTHQFTGLAGMSYHGGFIGGLFGMIFWCVRRKQKIFKWIDAMVVAIPAGYTFGRLGNFFNGELYGRITTMPWGVVFPFAEKFSASVEWVQEFAAQIGMDISEMKLVNLPRHPSQLYEAFFEGIVLFIILWLVHNHKKWHGMLASLYTIGYGIIRFFIEYFREPDSDIGYRIAKDANAPIYMNTSLLNFSTGQVLCFLMIIGGIGIGIGTYLYEKKRTKIGA
ncbi:MAG: prolipoprotein diacylglyceryl transferase [Treponema sp.]|nr:prolipoprotein diacylglyceryl transferase [Treponema sp.]